MSLKTILKNCNPKQNKFKINLSEKDIEDVTIELYYKDNNKKFDEENLFLVWSWQGAPFGIIFQEPCYQTVLSHLRPVPTENINSLYKHLKTKIQGYKKYCTKLKMLENIINDLSKEKLLLGMYDVDLTISVQTKAGIYNILKYLKENKNEN